MLEIMHYFMDCVCECNNEISDMYKYRGQADAILLAQACMERQARFAVR